jgi:AcrR family transcriptional regulator
MAFATARFAENGYHPTSVAEIVQGIGVGKGVFYWYFESKEQLLLEILKDAQKDLRRAQQRAIAGEEDPVRRLEKGIRATITWSAEHRDVYRLTQVAAMEERFAPVLRKGQEVAVQDAILHVRDGIQQGLVRDLDPAYIAHGILGVTAQLARTFIHERGERPEDVADAAVSLVLEGILVPEPTPAR